MNQPHANSLPRSGFTLIELMVVIGIIAILALMTLPSYFEKIARDQVEEALPLADFVKRPVAARWAATKEMHADNVSAELPEPNKIVSNLVSSVTVQDGAIHVVFGNRASGALKGKTVTLRPGVVEDAQIVPVAWVCGNAAVPGGMVARGVNRTDLPPNLLPLRCRG